ncbi:MAG TPA: YbhB/YbcL family Raf kinase inhibitor-like protein [Candidatus Limnocylindria bacterium]|nr:YbhB/YbcL family Raf kinase inhibitor-like protein [Candidatus Limnocylindria bacterium]
MQITSPAFLDNQSIPEQYTCDGQSLSIPLNFSNVPAEAKSLSLVMDDPDVPTALLPSGLFVHWVVFNMPATTTELAENQTPPGIQGNNGAGKAAYTAPCPPDKQHRYFFKLYALDAMLNLPGGATKDQLEQTMEGHIIAQAQLIGLYNKKINQK